MTLPGWVGIREPRGRLGGRYAKNVTICPTQACTTPFCAQSLAALSHVKPTAEPAWPHIVVCPTPCSVVRPPMSGGISDLFKSNATPPPTRTTSTASILPVRLRQLARPAQPLRPQQCLPNQPNQPNPPAHSSACVPNQPNQPHQPGIRAAIDAFQSRELTTNGASLKFSRSVG